jgi:hypothetical protein
LKAVLESAVLRIEMEMLYSLVSSSSFAINFSAWARAASSRDFWPVKERSFERSET